MPANPPNPSPIRKIIVVNASPERAFRFFTERMETWWPFPSHSVFAAERARLDVPNGPGAIVQEHAKDGRTCPWGRVLVWEPPARLVFSFCAYDGWENVTEVEVRFTEVEGGTRVELEHRGWEKLAEAYRQKRDGYDSGWEGVFVERFGKYMAEQCAA